MNSIEYIVQTLYYMKYVGSGGGGGPIIADFDMGSVPHLNQR